jgi:hypothetical protein
MHTTASYRLSSIIDCLVHWSEKVTEVQTKQELVTRIRREAKRVIDIYQADFSTENTNLEMINLLITLHRSIDFKIPVSQIETLFGLDTVKGKGYNCLNYFQICTLLYIIENDNYYKDIKKQLEDEIKSRLSNGKCLQKADNACLFFDVMTCPYLAKDTGIAVIEHCLGIEHSKAGVKKAKLAAPKRWFFDWDKTHDLTEFLEKKEYHSPYE